MQLRCEDAKRASRVMYGGQTRLGCNWGLNRAVSIYAACEFKDQSNQAKKRTLRPLAARCSVTVGAMQDGFRLALQVLQCQENHKTIGVAADTAWKRTRNTDFRSPRGRMFA